MVTPMARVIVATVDAEIASTASVTAPMVNVPALRARTTAKMASVVRDNSIRGQLRPTPI